MGSKFVKEELTKAERVTLKECLNNHNNKRVRSRAHIILLSTKGYPINILSEIYELDRDTVSLCISNWDKYGLVGLFDEPRSGRPSKLTSEEVAKLLEALKEEPRSIKRLLSYSNDKFGKNLSGETIKRLLRKLGQKWKRIQVRILTDKSSDEYKNKQAELKELEAKAARNEIELSYFDATGFSLIPHSPYAWQPIGENLTVNSSRSPRINVLGFMSLKCDLTSYTINGKVDSEVVISCFEEFLTTIIKETWVVLDNASIHTSAKFKAKRIEWAAKGLHLFYLPPRAPELNKIEILWRFIKYHWLSLKAYSNFESLKNYLNNLLINIGNKYRINFV